MYTEDDYLMISGIQHFFYCQRQWGLIHVEGQWESNIHTIRGDIIHEKVDEPFLMERRGGLIISRSVPVLTHEYRFYGVADLVEFTKSDFGVAIVGKEGRYQIQPVEYKKGKPKESNCDSIQLCLQAICLEEMYRTHIELGSIYYAKTRRRIDVEFGDSLRKATVDTIKQMHRFYSEGVTPKEEYSPKCNHCSLYNLCLPKVLSKKRLVKEYVLSRLTEESGCE